MLKADWWKLFDENEGKMRTLVDKYHPTSGIGHIMPISATMSEAHCKIVREEIRKESKVPGIVRFDEAVKSRDAHALALLLNDAWFGMPESMAVRSEPGFGALCDLCEGVDGYDYDPAVD